MNNFLLRNCVRKKSHAKCSCEAGLFRFLKFLASRVTEIVFYLFVLRNIRTIPSVNKISMSNLKLFSRVKERKQQYLYNNER